MLGAPISGFSSDTFSDAAFHGLAFLLCRVRGDLVFGEVRPGENREIRRRSRRRRWRTGPAAIPSSRIGAG